MSLISQLENKKISLKRVESVITKENGQKIKVMNIFNSGDGSENEEILLENKGCGFVVDTKPDDTACRVMLGLDDTVRLYIGSQDSAFNYQGLLDNNIKSILNVGYGIKNIYSDSIDYLSVEILDDVGYNIKDNFNECFEFLDKHQMKLKQGGTLVHCNAGISRSATILIAYLMNRFKLSLSESLSLLRQTRPAAKPNQGFISQLEDYEKELKKL